MPPQSPQSIKRHLIYIVDDDASIREMVTDLLKSQNHETRTFESAPELLAALDSASETCDLIVSDVSMPPMSGYELCKQVRSRKSLGRIPIVLVTGNDPVAERVIGLKAGADDFISKPFRHRDLLAKIDSLLAIRDDETARINTLKESVPPNVVDLLASEEREQILKPHRTEIATVFFDLRGFTAFSENSSPSAVLQVLNEYYETVGGAAIRHGGTFGYLAGDGIMVFFNDPKPQPLYLEKALRMALDARDELTLKREAWRRQQLQIDFGIGVSEGSATIGGFGFNKFWQYSAIGSSINLASRLCDVADQGKILLSQRYLSKVSAGLFQSKPVGEMSLKGLERPVFVHELLSVEDP